MDTILKKENLSEEDILNIFEKIDFLFPVLKQSFEFYKKLFLRLKEYLPKLSKKASYRIKLLGDMLNEIEKGIV